MKLDFQGAITEWQQVQDAFTVKASDVAKADGVACSADLVNKLKKKLDVASLLDILATTTTVMSDQGKYQGKSVRMTFTYTSGTSALQSQPTLTVQATNIMGTPIVRYEGYNFPLAPVTYNVTNSAGAVVLKYETVSNSPIVPENYSTGENGRFGGGFSPSLLPGPGTYTFNVYDVATHNLIASQTFTYSYKPSQNPDQLCPGGSVKAATTIV